MIQTKLHETDLSSKVQLRFESLINTRGGLGRLSPPLPTFHVRYTRRVLKATEKEILQGSQQRLGRVTVTVSYSRMFFTAKQVVSSSASCCATSLRTFRKGGDNDKQANVSDRRKIGRNVRWRNVLILYNHTSDRI